MRKMIQEFQGPLSVKAAVCLAIYGLPASSWAQSTPASPPPTPIEEVTVTATRRIETLEHVPYSLSVISGAQLGQNGVSDVASLATQVPGLSLYDYGARASQATPPIIRGINATGQPLRAFRSFEQSPVGTYVGNSPVDGYVQLQDLKQVEVLRGPQGTLYGAGALGGALRLIPNAPKLGSFEGSVEAGVGRLAQSGGTPYSVAAVVNVPIGDTLAFRASGRYAYDPGFVDAFGLFELNHPGVSGIPLLANPNDPVNSPPIYSERKDWNWQRSFTGRASLLWQPNSAFNAEIALLHTDVRGDGGPVVNLDFPGGISPLDPQTTLPRGGREREFTQVDQPFSRYTNLMSLDLSVDVGFATVSSTSSYRSIRGHTLEDNTYNLAGLADGLYLTYYAGQPANPRFVFDWQFGEDEHSFSQEIRLVSNSSPASRIDYVAGAYFEQQTSRGTWFVANPGSPQRSIAQGCTGPIFVGASFPDCLLLSGPNDVAFIQDDTQKFRDVSVFGEITWHVTRHTQLTGGVRHFSQRFTDSQLYQDFTFPTLILPDPQPVTASKTVGKVNASLEYAPNHFVYALWSQGFRRGGANSIPSTGFFQESPGLRNYAPDKTNNYEVGLKGRFGSEHSYTLAVFDIKWDSPQISASLPDGNLAVYNAKTAESRGIEFESAGPMPIPSLTYVVGVAYADAKLTSDFALPANNGAGVIVPGLVSGVAGEQLPGSPKVSTSATLNYLYSPVPTYDLTLGINGVYRSATKLNLASSLGVGGVQESSSFALLNLSATLAHRPWRIGAYVTNLLNRQNILAPPTQPNQVNRLTNDYVVNRPREVGLKLAYSF